MNTSTWHMLSIEENGECVDTNVLHVDSQYVEPLTCGLQVTHDRT